MGTSVDDYILANRHKPGEAIARELGMDGANVRKRIRKLRVMSPHHDWYTDPRQTSTSTGHSEGSRRRFNKPKPHEGRKVEQWQLVFTAPALSLAVAATVAASSCARPVGVDDRLPAECSTPPAGQPDDDGGRECHDFSKPPGDAGNHAQGRAALRASHHSPALSPHWLRWTNGR